LRLKTLNVFLKKKLTALAFKIPITAREELEQIPVAYTYV